MTILCATDFSPSSHQATHLAGALALRTGDPVVLVHVIEPLLQAIPYGIPGAAIWEGELKTSSDALLAGTVKVLRERGVKADSYVVIGSPASTLLSLAAERKARLLVMGIHGRKGLGRLFLGSVTEDVVKTSTCPVLVTRTGDVISPRWDSAQPLRMVVGVDGTHVAESVLAFLPTLPDGVVDPTIVRLFWPFEEAIRYGLDEPWRGDEPNPQLLPLLDRDVRHLARPFLGGDSVSVSFRVAHVNAAQVFSDESRRLEADAVVVGVAHGRPESWNALVVRDVLEAARVPVLCVPQTAATGKKGITAFRSVLVATDLSDASNQAVLSAYGSMRAGGRVELVHVHVHDIESGLATPFAAPTRIDRRPLTEEGRHTLVSRLKELVPRESATRGIATNVSVIDAPLASIAILQAAERLNVDLIALASHHRSGLKRAVLGSVAEDVTRRSPRPVLITSIGAGT